MYLKPDKSYRKRTFYQLLKGFKLANEVRNCLRQVSKMRIARCLWNCRKPVKSAHTMVSRSVRIDLGIDLPMARLNYLNTGGVCRKGRMFFLPFVLTSINNLHQVTSRER